MKDKGLIIVVVLVVLAVVVYFSMKRKPGANVSTTMSNESTTGVTALFNTGAMSSLFGTFGSVGNLAGSVVNTAPKTV